SIHFTIVLQIAPARLTRSRHTPCAVTFQPATAEGYIRDLLQSADGTLSVLAKNQDAVTSARSFEAIVSGIAIATGDSPCGTRQQTLVIVPVATSRPCCEKANP